MQSYSIDQCQLSWLGNDLQPGLSQGTVIVEARTSPAYSQRSSALGAGRIAYNPDRSGTVTITVDQESQEHQDLVAIANAARDPGERGSKVGNMTFRDGGTTQDIVWKNAYIQSEADDSRAIEGISFTWVFGFEDVSKTAVNPVGNAVGT